LIANPDAEVRRSAAWQLGKFGSKTPEVIEALAKLKSDRNPLVQKAAAWAMKSLGIGPTDLSPS